MGRGKEKPGRGSGVWLIALFVVGAAILFYPTISFWLAAYNQVQAIESYASIVSNLSADEIEAQWRRAQDYNARLSIGPVKDPFAATEDVSPFDEYFEVLDIGDGMMGSIRIPSVSIRLPIYHGTSDAILEKGVGHIKATALPVGGPSTHAVLTAHTGLHSAAMFDRLIDVNLGDVFLIDVLDRTLPYRVKSIDVIDPDDITKLRVIPDEDLVTLLTCTPYGINSHRLLVTGARCELDMIPTEGRATQPFPCWVIALVVLLVVAIVAGGEYLRRRRTRTVGERTS